MNITELLAAIRVWQAANEEYQRAKAESPNHTSQRRRDAIDASDVAALAVVKRNHDYPTLEALVALADEIERLQARIDAALAIPKIPHPGITVSGLPEARTSGANLMRAEIHKALRGEG